MDKNVSVSQAYAILVQVSVHDLVRFPMYDEHDKRSQVNIFRLR